MSEPPTDPTEDEEFSFAALGRALCNPPHGIVVAAPDRVIWSPYDGFVLPHISPRRSALAPSEEHRPRWKQRRTDPEGIEHRLRVFHGRAFALRSTPPPSLRQLKSIRTEASNLYDDLPADHSEREAVFKILCEADDLIED